MGNSTAGDVAAVAGLGTSGVLMARGLADSDLANNILTRLMTTRKPAAGQPDFRVPVYAGADLNLTHGSGEAVMASRISRMLNRHGVGSYYTNTQWRPNDGDIAGGFDNPNPKTGRSWWGNDVHRNVKFWSDNTRINGSNLDNLVNLRTNFGGKEGNALSEILSKFEAAGVPQEQAMALLRSGKFNGFTPGELVDALGASGQAGIRDIAAGKAHLAAYSDMGGRLWGKKLPYLMSGETGMNYSTIGADPKAVAENTYPFQMSPRTRNLGLDTQFQANYRAPSDPLIPGSGMYDPGFGRRSRAARMWQYYAPRALGGGGRAEYNEAIRRLLAKNGIDPKTVPRGTKYMLISTGSAGANAAEKLRLAEKAFGNDPNVRILLQYGKRDAAPASAGLDLYTNNGVLEAVEQANKRRPGFVLAFDKDPAYATLARNVDLHGTYGGSSTITEALANTNPTVTMTDTALNRGNNNYGTARRGIRQVDSAATAIGRQLKADPNLERVVNYRDGEQTLGQAIKSFGLEGVDYAKREEEAIQALRDAMYKSPGKFNKESIRAANGILAEQAARNKSFVSTVRALVTNAINKSDAARYQAMKPGFRKLMAGVPRALFRTPAGRRIGIPLALLSALGIGGAIYKGSK